MTKMARQSLSAPTPTTVKGRRTRTAMIHAAREVFEEKGFEETRIADIVKQAGIAHGTFYRYFDSKHEIFHEVVKTVTGEMFSASRPETARDSDPIERIRESTERYLLAYSDNARIMHVIEQVSPRDPFYADLLLQIRALFVERIVAGTKRLQDEGLAESGIDVETTASILGGMVEQIARVWFLLGEEYNYDVVLETVTRLWARGIGLTYPAAPRVEAGS